MNEIPLVDNGYEKDDSFFLPQDIQDFIIKNRCKEKKTKNLYVFLFIAVTVVVCIYCQNLYVSLERKLSSFSRSSSVWIDQNSDPLNKITTEWLQYDHFLFSTSKLWITNKGSYDLKSIPLPLENLQSITSVAWKSVDDFFVALCNKGLCTIKLINQSDLSETVYAQTDCIAIPDMIWSQKNENLYFICQKVNIYEYRQKTLSTDNILKVIDSTHQRQSEYEDDLSVSISFDENKILFSNTFVNQNQPSILVLNKDGTEVLSLPIKENLTPSNGLFINNDKILFRNDEYLYTYALESKEEEVVSKRILNALAPTYKVETGLLSYWTYDYKGRIATIWIYDMKQETLTRLKDNCAHPFLIDNTHVLYGQMISCKNNSCPDTNLLYDRIGMLSTETFVSSDILKLPIEGEKIQFK